MTRLRPSEIRYVQDSISNTFDRRSRHSNVRIGQTLDNLCDGRIRVDDIPTISVYQKDGLYWSLDNRRLWVFKHYERLGGCTDIPVCVSSYWCVGNKFTTYNQGVSVRVRGSPGGVWSCKPDGALNPNKSWVIETRNYAGIIGNPSQGGAEPLSTATHPLVHRLLTQPICLDALRISHTKTPDSLLQSNLSVSETLNPDDIKYTKLTIPSTFSSGIHMGQRLDALVQLLRSNKLIDVPAITVYHVFDEYYAVNGNRRLWVYRQAKTHMLDLEIPVIIRNNKEEFLAEVRKNNKCQLTLRDIIMMGDDIQVAYG